MNMTWVFVATPFSSAGYVYKPAWLGCGCIGGYRFGVRRGTTRFKSCQKYFH